MSSRDDKRTKPWQVRFVSQTPVVISHRYSAESIVKKIRILQDDDISDKFNDVHEPQKELCMGHSVLSSTRGRGTVVKLGTKGTQIMFASPLGVEKSSGVCKLSNDEVVASIRYTPIGTKPPGQIPYLSAGQKLFRASLDVVLRVLRFITPSRNFANFVNNVNPLGSDEVVWEDHWLQKYGCLFDEYHDQRSAYLAGAVFTLKAFIFGTVMAAAQELPQFCRIEGWVVTVTGWLTTAYCLYSRPFFEPRYNVFLTLDFFLQAVGLSFLMHTHSSGEGTQKQILITLALMVVAQLYFNLADMFVEIQAFIVTKLMQALGLLFRICCWVSAKVGLTPILQCWSTESCLGRLLVDVCDRLSEVPTNVSNAWEGVKTGLARLKNKLLRVKDDDDLQKDLTEPGPAMYLAAQRDANLHEHTSHATTSLLALQEPLPAPVPGVLTVTILKATGLAIMDHYCLDKGSSDPYVKIKVGDHGVKKSTVKEKELNPVWHETFSFQVESMDDEIVLELWDLDSWWKITTDDFMGQVALGTMWRLLCLHPAVVGNTVQFGMNLKAKERKSMLTGRPESAKDAQGKLHFTLKLSPDRHRAGVIIILWPIGPWPTCS